MTPPVRTQEIALRGLHEAGWLSDEMHDAILRAARHAVDPEHLLEFIVAIGHLERIGVPVVDAIDMTIEAGGSLNLRWSARRWREEHDRLGRMLAARRLAEEMEADTPFDTEWLERVLPPRSDPRWRDIEMLDSPRRLAEEGQELHHCIASARYVDRFRRGALGGVSVTEGGKRWTVTVVPVPGGAPSIVAIHGLRNATPGWETRLRIRRILGSAIDDPEPEPVAAPSSAAYRGVYDARWGFCPRLI